MKQILFEFAGMNISAWHTFFFLGAVAIFSSFLWLNLKSDHPLKRNQVIDFYLLLYTSSYLGARVFSIFMDENVSSFLGVIERLTHLGPMTFYGGFILSVMVGVLYVKFNYLDKRRIYDISLVSVFAGLFFGRIGCFLNGDDYGISCTDVSWLSSVCVIFPNLNDHIYRVPVQLFESVGALIIFTVGVLLSSRLKKGYTGSICVLLYSVLRFNLEFLRGDERGHIIFDNLSSSQTLSICLAVYALVSMLMIKKGSN